MVSVDVKHHVYLLTYRVVSFRLKIKLRLKLRLSISLGFHLGSHFKPDICYCIQKIHYTGNRHTRSQRRI